MLTPALANSREIKGMQPRILIADDQPDVQLALALLLKGHGYVTEAVSSPAVEKRLTWASSAMRCRDCTSAN